VPLWFALALSILWMLRDSPVAPGNGTAWPALHLDFHPDGTRLLLANGWGGVWLAPLERGDSR
jgi:hypothetical protein